MAALKIYDGSSWVTAVAKTYNGSAWEDQMKFYDGTAWQELAGLVISPSANGDTDNFRINSNCYAGIQFSSNGTEYEYNATGGLVSVGSWLDSGSASDVWVERIITAGTFDDIDPGTGRHQLSTTRSFRLIRTTTGTDTVTCYFKFWDAASGGTLLQQTSSASWVAERETGM